MNVPHHMLRRPAHLKDRFVKQADPAPILFRWVPARLAPYLTTLVAMLFNFEPK